jgi:hypothetical protein
MLALKIIRHPLHSNEFDACVLFEVFDKPEPSQRLARWSKLLANTFRALTMRAVAPRHQDE